MRRTLFTLPPVLLLVSSALVASGPNVEVRRTADGELERCDQLEFRFDGRAGARDEQHLSIPRSEAATLTAAAPNHGGIHVRGTDGDAYEVSVCKGVPGDADRAALDRLTVTNRGGRLQIDGPDGSPWVVYLIVAAPRSAGLNLEATNGPLAVRDMTGPVRVESRNGPVSIGDCSGQVNVETRNGPIKYSGHAGDVSLLARNGPIGVILTGPQWQGSFEARTENGPVKLGVPASFQSGLRVRSSRHAPWKCDATACAGGNRTWTEDKLEFSMGTGEPVVRVSTGNGPVAIANTR